MVDLEFLACQNVNVSFAAVNMNGVSYFSPATVVCIFGGMAEACLCMCLI